MEWSFTTRSTHGARTARTTSTRGTPKPIVKRNTDMKGAIMAAVTVLSTGADFAETENFDQHKPGAVPAGWECGVTRQGSRRWTVGGDRSARRGRNVRRQAGSGTSPR